MKNRVECVCVNGNNSGIGRLGSLKLTEYQENNTIIRRNEACMNLRSFTACRGAWFYRQAWGESYTVRYNGTT